VPTRQRLAGRVFQCSKSHAPATTRVYSVKCSPIFFSPTVLPRTNLSGDRRRLGYISKQATLERSHPQWRSKFFHGPYVSSPLSENGPISPRMLQFDGSCPRVFQFPQFNEHILPSSRVVLCRKWCREIRIKCENIKTQRVRNCFRIDLG